MNRNRRSERRVARRFACLIASCAILLAAADCVVAAPVYRCVGPNAAVAYQDRACGADAGHPLELAEAEPGPVPPAVQELVARYEARRSERPVRPPRATRRARERSAYRCTTSDGAVSYRSGPCPRPRASRGKPALAVHEAQVSAREACEGRWLLLDPYERDKRGPPECGLR